MSIDQAKIEWEWDSSYPFQKDYDPQIIGGELYRIATREGVEVASLRADVVFGEVVANPSSPLRPFFELDGEKAALNWNHEQARRLIRGIRYTVVSEGKREVPRRAWAISNDGDGKRSYQFVPEILSDDGKATRLLADCISYLEAAKRRYNDIASARKDIERQFGRLDKVIEGFRRIEADMKREKEAEKAKRPRPRADVGRSANRPLVSV